jgi:hypothetical protein
MKPLFDQSYREMVERTRKKEARQRRIVRYRLLFWLLPLPFGLSVMIGFFEGTAGLSGLFKASLVLMGPLAVLGLIDYLLKNASNRQSHTEEHPWEGFGTVAGYVLVQLLILMSLVLAGYFVNITTEPERPPGWKAPMY